MSFKDRLDKLVGKKIQIVSEIEYCKLFSNNIFHTYEVTKACGMNFSEAKVDSHHIGKYGLLLKSITISTKARPGFVYY